MATQAEGFGHMTAEVLSVQGECSAGHKAGDVLKVGCWDTGGLCGFFYHDIFPALSVIQFGGKYPWEGEEGLTLECPDKFNLVKIQLKRP